MKRKPLRSEKDVCRNIYACRMMWSTWRLLLERSNLQMVAKLREGLGRESKDMALKSTISSLSSSVPLLLSVFFLTSTFKDSGCWKRCCCSYIILYQISEPQQQNGYQNFLFFFLLLWRNGKWCMKLL